MILVAIVFSFGLAAHAQQRPIVGGYRKTSTTAVDVVKAAEFAVAEAGRKDKEAEITLTSIERAEKQVVAGTNYRLCLRLEINGESQDIKAIVFQSLKNALSLVSWENESCDEGK
jgi:hypothetical protein